MVAGAFLTLLLFARMVSGQYRSLVAARPDDSGTTGVFKARTGMVDGLAQATSDLEADERHLGADDSNNGTEAPTETTTTMHDDGEDSNSNKGGDTQTPMPQPANPSPTPGPTAVPSGPTVTTTAEETTTAVDDDGADSNTQTPTVTTAAEETTTAVDDDGADSKSNEGGDSNTQTVTVEETTTAVADDSNNGTEAPTETTTADDGGADGNSNEGGDTQAPTPQPSNQGPTPAPTPNTAIPSPTPVPTPAGGGKKPPKVEALNMKVKVQGVDYIKLKQNATALEAFETATRAGLAAALGIDESDILELLLSAGSVAVEAVIKPPEGVTASALKAKVTDNPEVFKTTVVETIITKVQGELEAAGVVTGELQVGEPVAEIVKVDPPDNGDGGNETDDQDGHDHGDGDGEDDGKGAVGKALPQAAGTLLGALAALAAAVRAA